VARFDCATWRPISSNTSGRLGPNLGLILHHAVANGSLFNLFNSPSAQVSAHFWVAQSGAIEQYVDTDVIAWHARDLNGSYCGVETEGCSSSPYADPMSAAMLAALGRLFAEGMRRHGWPAVLCQAKGQPGLGYHRLPGSDNGPGGSFPTACPCDVRLSRRQDVLNAAQGTAPPPKPTTPKGPTMWLLQDPESGGWWQLAADGGIFAYDGAPFLGGSNNAQQNANGWPVAGLANFEDPSGAGYCITLDAGTTPGGDRFRRLRYPRDGSARV
jgi:N-acetylmuramoyl-L-alanine amidase